MISGYYRYYFSLEQPRESARFGREGHVRNIKRDLKWALEEEDWMGVRDLAAKLLRFEPQEPQLTTRLAAHRERRGRRARIGGS